MYVQSSLLRFIKEGKSQTSGLVGGSAAIPLGALIKEKSAFFALVLGTLAFQLFLVIVVVNVVHENSVLHSEVKRFMILMFLVQLAIVVIIAIVPMPVFVKFALFSLFSVLMGLTLNIALKNVSKNVINTALVGTVIIFVSFIILGIILTMMGINLGPFGLILFFALLLLVLTNFVFLFMSTSDTLKKVLVVISLIIFAGYISYDTNKILRRDYRGDFVTGAFDYFLDVINVFLSLIRLMDTRN